jgi:hypothetical protein
MIEKHIWELAHHFKTELTQAERERHKVYVVGNDNFYLFSFMTNNKIKGLGGIVQFKIEKNYKITTSSVEYKISQVRVNGQVVSVEYASEQSKVNELLYNRLIPYIRELKLHSLGI